MFFKCPCFLAIRSSIVHSCFKCNPNPMILTRYLYKEVTAITLGITSVLLLTLMSNQFIHYLGAAAQGKLAVTAVFQLVVYTMPYLLGLLLPLSLFLSVLWAYGRWAQEGELMIIKTCGFGTQRLHSALMIFAVVVMILVAVLIFWLRPAMYRARATWYADAAQGSILKTLLPGRFQSSHNDQHVFYVESMSRDHKRVKDVFMAERHPPKEGETEGSWVIQAAHKGMQRTDPDNEQSYLVTTQGYRYEGKPGTPHFRVIKYADNGVLIPSVLQVSHLSEQAWTLKALWQKRKKNPKAMAELQWRWSMPLSVVLLVLCALALLQNTRGHNRYAILLPALIIYIFYMNMLIVGRNWITEQRYGFLNGLWWVHVLIALIALICFFQPKSKLLRAKYDDRRTLSV